MHNLQRLLTLALFLILLVPAGTYALVSMDTRLVTQESLQSAIDLAVGRYRQRTSLQSLRKNGEQTIARESQKLRDLEREKHRARQEEIAVRATITLIEERHGINIESPEQVKTLLEREKLAFARAFAEAYRRRLIASRDESETDLLRSAIREDISSDRVQAGRIDALLDQKRLLISDLDHALDVLDRLDRVSAYRETILIAYHDSDQELEEAHEMVEMSEEKMTEIQAIMADVHAQVLKLQGELARIEARLRTKAERALIEKGLLDPKRGGTAGQAAVKPSFSWPVYGTVSAGFQNESYKKHFGVPHHGLDIVVGESTPVAAAAHGVVFLVRDGGATGYTYVLIGHRGGFATLYGHLLGVSVTAGQEVAQGEVIGASGGRPGTYGAGPMTTGPHLHFEVIQSGVNIDPKTVLP